MDQGLEATVGKERIGMSDTPRMSRRQMREQGKLAVRPADGIDVSETTELRLRRPSRKELREARKGETGMLPAVSDAEEKNSQPERLSVFDRFEVAKQDEAESTTKVVRDETVEPEEKPEVSLEEVAPEDLESDTDDSIDDSYETTMRERLLSMTRRKHTEENQEVANGDISRTSVMPEGADLDDDELSQLVAPEKVDDESLEKNSSDLVSDSDEAMSYYEDDDDSVSPRRTILNYILLILIATLVGILVGLVINSVFFSASPAFEQEATLLQQFLL